MFRKRAGVVGMVGALVLVLGVPAMAAEVTDPGAAGDGFVNATISTDYIMGSYTMSVAIVLPTGMVTSTTDSAQYGFSAVLCSEADGGGSCGSRTSIGSASDDWSEGLDTVHARISGTETGGWCGSQCYVDVSTILIGGAAGQIIVDGSWIASEDMVIAEGSVPAPWPEDWYSSSGNPSYVPPSGAPTIEVDGLLLPDMALDLWLDAPDHNGEDVTCTVQGDPSSPYAGTVASDVFDIWVQDSFPDNGIFAVECVADDGVFDDTDPEIGSVRRLLTVGSGLENVLGEDCGAWYNIACHFGTALTWAFVPDADVLYEMWDDLTEATETGWPVGPLTSSVSLLGDIMRDFGYGVKDPGHYRVSAQKCANDWESEDCEHGILLGGNVSSGGDPLWGPIPFAGGSEGGGLDFPETRVLGAPEVGTAFATWANLIRNILRIVLVAGVARLVIALAGWIMGRNPPGQMSMNFKD